MKTMSKIKEEIKDGMKLIRKKVDPEDLKHGDHIYVYRLYGIYSHHGIYEKGGYVIHYNVTKGKEATSSLSRGKLETVSACPVCGYQQNTGRGVIKTCLDCFRRHNGKLHSIHYFMYDAPEWGYLLKNSGTCSTRSRDKSPEEVVDIANELLESSGFGDYDVVTNNCEHFVTYCRTGERASEQTAFYGVLRRSPEMLRNGSRRLSSSPFH
ncbi:hypothetical protein BT93_L1726 [Corymbia citriodora subsp. variegata]|uniref:LRAT domain-containing protein n=1 Tax=Corymbia citriodora subsp. variegata TaxID=360336 RepID=A0A8T0CRI6_CORYI|nr:hypothetical protein BT93_L1726 [Corymbia citriodora subsp. variegata]